MDLSSINNSKKANSLNEVAFQGQKTVKNSSGKSFLRVYPPHSIQLKDKEELGIELIALSEEKDPFKPYEWKVVSDEPIEVEVDNDFKSGKKTYFNIPLEDYWLDNSGELGYRFVVKKADGSKEYYADSIGTNIDFKEGEEFTIASTRMGSSRNAGPMEHIFTDSYNTLENVKKKNRQDGVSDEDTLKAFRRNHLNRAGGSIEGIVDKLNNSDELDAVKLIMTTPLIGGGKTSSHMYHPANHFHISDGMGSKKDFLELQKACFNKGKGYVLDGAFTSQGYEGLQFNHAIQNPDSPFKYWFKTPVEDGYKLGVLPDIDIDHVGVRIVNPDGVPGYKYDKNMPSYIQFYDTRLAGDQLKDMGKLITQYDKPVTDDPYEISLWNDGTLNNYFEIDPQDKAFYGKKFGSFKEWENIFNTEDVANPHNRLFNFVRRGDAGGYTGWDGNIDMVKMNLCNHVNSPEMIEGNKQARNYIYNVASYWTKETKDALILDIANKVHNKDAKARDAYFKEIEHNFNLEKGTLNKIKYDKYDYKIGNDKRDTSKLLFEKILDFPLESLSFSPELLGVMSTPYITPRPSDKGNPAASKTEIFNDAVQNERHPLLPKMQKIYTEILPGMVKDIMASVQDDSKPLFEQNGNEIMLTEFGKYFLEMSLDDIMEFLMTESLFKGDTDAYDEKGDLDYEGSDKRQNTEGNGKRFSINRLGISRTTSKGEAVELANKLEDGLLNLRNDKPDEFNKFLDYLNKKYYSLNLHDYQTAEAVIDQTGGGLNWRFDAAKDVGDWDEAKNRTLTSAQVWDDVIDFWTPFMNNVRSINPSSYVVAEVTSLWDFKDYDWGDKYTDADKAERVFYEKTGATTGSNYSVYFGLYPKLFGKNIEEGAVEGFRSIDNFLNRTQSFIKPPKGKGNVASEFIIGSHVFLDNHDKPRAAHLMAVDSAYFWSGFNGDFEKKYKERTEKILNREFSDNMNSMAAAVAEKYLQYFENAAKDNGLDNEEIAILKKAIVHLANGYAFNDIEDKTPSFKRAEAFASTPYEVTIPHVTNLASKMGLNMSLDTKKEIEKDVFLSMVKPYMSKMPAVYEMMAGTTGIGTLFAGDEFAQTGCETKSKNVQLGCRNLIRHDWINENSPNFNQEVYDFNKRIKAVGLLSKQDGMAPLANGTPVVIPVKQHTVKEMINIMNKDALIKGFLGACNEMGNIKSLCKFVPDIEDYDNQDKAFQAAKSALEKMDEKTLKEKVYKYVSDTKTFNEGLYGWAVKNLKDNMPVGYETGSIYKYNDKGEGVLSVFTNAYIPENPDDISPLLSKGQVKNPPKISDIKLVVNQNGKEKPFLEPGTKFVRMVYDGANSKGEYVEKGIFTLQEDGTLKGEGMYPDSILDSTVTYFKRLENKKFYPPNGRAAH